MPKNKKRYLFKKKCIDNNRDRRWIEQNESMAQMEKLSTKNTNKYYSLLFSLFLIHILIRSKRFLHEIAF